MSYSLLGYDNVQKRRPPSKRAPLLLDSATFQPTNVDNLSPEPVTTLQLPTSSLRTANYLHSDCDFVAIFSRNSQDHTRLQGKHLTMVQSTTLLALMTTNYSCVRLTLEYNNVSLSKEIGIQDSRVSIITLLIMPYMWRTIVSLIGTLLVYQMELS